jgi:AcrR family transcriptional regulator
LTARRVPRNSTAVRFFANDRFIIRPVSINLVQQAFAALRARDARPRKGETTRAAIVEAALALASREGLEGLTIGLLAERLGMSKSGVIAHFGTREDLQLAVLGEYARRFVEDVLRPAVNEPRGLPRLEAILDRWLNHLARELDSGCIMIGGAFEYDDREGPLRDAMVAIIAAWQRELHKAIQQAVAAGDLRTDVDAGQLVFEIYGLMLATHQGARLMRSHNLAVRHARSGLARLITAARRTRAPRAAAGRAPRRSTSRKTEK